MKKKKIGIFGILNNPATSMNSHSAGWNMLVKDIMKFDNAEFINEKSNWNDYTTLIMLHGPNYKAGQYNIIGGVTDGLLVRIENLIDAHKNGVEILSFDEFCLVDFCKKRKQLFGYLDEVKDIDLEILELPKFNSRVAVGDSHVISVWPGATHSVVRNDGKTLYGFLKSPRDCTGGLYNFANGSLIYFGNIDIRFHLPRQENPVEATIDLAKKYAYYCRKSNLTPVCLLPIEDESRKLPKSGMYKGEKFFGSQRLRTWLVDVFNTKLDEEMNGDVVKWPKEWYEDTYFFMNEVLEPRQSVHIRPKYYKRFNSKGTPQTVKVGKTLF